MCDWQFIWVFISVPFCNPPWRFLHSNFSLLLYTQPLIPHLKRICKRASKEVVFVFFDKSLSTFLTSKPFKCFEIRKSLRQHWQLKGWKLQLSQIPISVLKSYQIGYKYTSYHISIYTIHFRKNLQITD